MRKLIPNEGDARQVRDLLKRILYQQQPLEYISERLRVPPETINWKLLPAYTNHKWDGTPNPLMSILEALAASRWVGVESGVGCGKTFLAACVALWFFECFENSIVVTTAPKEAQLSLHIWKEIGKLHPVAGIGFMNKLILRMIESKDQWIIVGFIAGVKAEEAEASATKAQGFHAEHMLIITEETPGIAPAVLTAFQNTCTSPHNLILALGNPDHAKDPLHEFCKLPNVKHVRISGFDHPNVVLDDPNFIAGAQSRVGLSKLLSRYKNETNPLYLSRAKGISPEQSVHSLIRLEWCYAARDRKATPEMLAGPSAMGVDVANSEAGDKAAIARGRGAVLEYIEDFQCPDSNKLGEQVAVLMTDHKIEPQHVGVDGVGVGAGTVNKLKELGKLVTNLISSEKPAELYEVIDEDEAIKQEERYANLRSQMWWQLRLDLQFGRICLPDNEELFADLVTPQWAPENGKIVVEKKEKIKKRLGRSPNLGDACVYWNWVRHLRAGVGAAASGDAGESDGRSGNEDDTYKAERKRLW